jgi:hypothetical protein
MAGQIISKKDKKGLIKIRKSSNSDLKLRRLERIITKAWKTETTASELIIRERR